MASALAGAPALAGQATPASTTVIKSFHSSSGGGTTARISDHGNIVDYLSPDSNDAGHYEHIGVGAIGEGYVLCYTGAAGLVNAWDTGVSESGFGPATTSGSTATAITITRKTNDNRLTLTQNITFNGVERAVRIKMTLKNNTPSPIPNVTLRRQVDFDVDTGGTDGWASFSNWHAATSLTTAFAWNDPSDAPPGKDAHAMYLKFVTSPTVTTNHRAFVTSDILDHTCGADTRIAALPKKGDFGDTQVLNVGLVPAGASRTATVEYARF